MRTSETLRLKYRSPLLFQENPSNNKYKIPAYLFKPKAGSNSLSYRLSSGQKNKRFRFSPFQRSNVFDFLQKKDNKNSVKNSEKSEGRKGGFKEINFKNKVLMNNVSAVEKAFIFYVGKRGRLPNIRNRVDKDVAYLEGNNDVRSNNCVELNNVGGYLKLNKSNLALNKSSVLKERNVIFLKENQGLNENNKDINKLSRNNDTNIINLIHRKNKTIDVNKINYDFNNPNLTLRLSLGHRSKNAINISNLLGLNKPNYIASNSNSLSLIKKNKQKLTKPTNNINNTSKKETRNKGNKIAGQNKSSKISASNLTRQNFHRLLKSSQIPPKNLLLNFNKSSSHFFKAEADLSEKSAENSSGRMGDSGERRGRKTHVKSRLAKYGIKTMPGNDINGHVKVNQDNYMVKSRIKGVEFFSAFAVFDGHGTNGHLVSKFLRTYFSDFFTNIPSLLEQERLQNSDHPPLASLLHSKLSNEKFIVSAFENAEKLLKNQVFDTESSGSTGVFVLHLEDKLICYNVGDSRAVFINEFYQPVQISVDHKADIPEEEERIVGCGGRVDRLPGTLIGPFRVWLKNEDFPGLAMSRSFGDFIAESVGVVCDPDIFEVDIVKNKVKCVVLASDGLWEFTSNERVAEICKPFIVKNDCVGCTKRLMEEARKSWMRDNSVICDDITIIVVFFRS